MNHFRPFLNLASFFEAAGAAAKNWLELLTEPPWANLSELLIYKVKKTSLKGPFKCLLVNYHTRKLDENYLALLSMLKPLWSTDHLG